MTDNEDNISEKEKPVGKFLTTDKIILIVGIVGILAVFGILSIMKWSLVDQPFFGGIFNTAFWGTPLYVFFIPIALLMYFVAWAYWAHLRWDMMAPFHGLYVAMTSRSDVIFKTDANLNFILKSEAGACLVFEKDRYNNLVEHKYKFLTNISKKLRPVDQSTDFAKYLQGSWETKPVVNIGSIPSSILLDANGWTKDVSPERVEIAKECDFWNETNQNDQIHSLAKAWKYMNNGNIIKPKNVELYINVPWVRIDNAYSSSRNPASWGGFLRQLAETLAKSEGAKGLNMTWAGIAVFVVSIAISAMMFVMKIMSHTPIK
jgi:hypothetical protein